MGNIKVSVIIPFFNGIDYLEDCVRSVCAQTLREIEILLVDDGSTDGCGALADTLAQKDARIRVIHQKNSGVSAARNAALAVANGEYIGFVDADDIAEPAMYEILYGAAVQNRCEIVTGAYSSFNETGIISRSAPPFLPGTVLHAEQIADLLPTLSTQNTFLFIWRRLFSAELIRKNHITFDTQISVGEDSLFCLHCFLAAERVTAVPGSVYRYRHRPGSAMRSTRYKPNLLCSLNKMFTAECALIESYAPRMLEAFCRDFAVKTSAMHAPVLLSNIMRKDGGRRVPFREFCRSDLVRNMRRFRKAWDKPSRSLDYVVLRLICRRMYCTAYALSRRVFAPKHRCAN